MSILSDNEILELCASGMITPYASESIRKENDRKITSRGVSSYGYDVSLRDYLEDGTPAVKIFTNQNASIINPKALDEGTLIDATIRELEDGSRYVILPPNSYLLGVTVEWFDIPRDVTALCLGKSTYARAGCICNATPIEAGFRGNVVIELSNATTLPMMVYLNEGIAQFLFFRGNPCAVSYADRDGKYQNQTGVTLPLV